MKASFFLSFIALAMFCYLLVGFTSDCIGCSHQTVSPPKLREKGEHCTSFFEIRDLFEIVIQNSTRHKLLSEDFREFEMKRYARARAVFEAWRDLKDIMRKHLAKPIIVHIWSNRMRNQFLKAQAWLEVARRKDGQDPLRKKHSSESYPDDNIFSNEKKIPLNFIQACCHKRFSTSLVKCKIQRIVALPDS